MSNFSVGTEKEFIAKLTAPESSWGLKIQMTDEVTTLIKDKQYTPSREMIDAVVGVHQKGIESAAFPFLYALGKVDAVTACEEFYKISQKNTNLYSLYQAFLNVNALVQDAPELARLKEVGYLAHLDIENPDKSLLGEISSMLTGRFNKQAGENWLFALGQEASYPLAVTEQKALRQAVSGADSAYTSPRKKWFGLA
jgi:hypothetical protein